MKSKNFYVIFYIILFFASNFTFGQNKITGTITDSTKNEKIAFANVGLLRTKDSALISGTATDENGSFTLKNIPNGHYNFIISAIGYNSYKKQINVTGNVDLGTIKLASGTTKLDEIEIVEKKPLFANEGEKTLYNVTEDPSIQTGTASDALQNAPGVEVDVEGNVTLRGVSSVEIWINDQPSHLNAENLKTYLQQLPANSIERIEVITNPSARYATKGDGGVINIITKSKVQKNEFVSIGLRGSTTPNISPWASYVWANDKISFNAYLNFSYYKYNFDSHGYSTSFKNNVLDPEVLDTTSNRTYTNHGNSRSYNGGSYLNFEYNIDTMNNLSIWLGCWLNYNNNTSNENVYRKEYFEEADLYHYITDNKSNSFGIFINSGLYYTHKFNSEGHNLSFNYGGTLMSGKSNDKYQQYYDEQTWMNVIYKRDNHYNDFNWSTALDYNLPFNKKGEIGLGISYSHDPDTYYLTHDTLNSISDVYVKDSIRSFDRKACSDEFDAYLTFQYKFGNFTVKPGIRMEYDKIYCNIDGYESDHNDKSYLNWSPSLHLSYRTKSMHNFKLSYTRRVSNPDSRNLTNFLEYDIENFSMGNINLKSTFTNSFECGWTKYWNNFGSVGLTAYYRNSKNTVNTVSDVIFNDFFGRYVSYTQPVNLGKTFNTGAEINLTYRPNAMLNVRCYANIYDAYYETFYDKLGTKKISSEKLTYSLRVNLWTKLWNKLEINASCYYRSPSQTFLAEREANYSINCGLHADFFDRKLSIYVNANDIFNWNKWDNNTTNPYYISYDSMKYTSRSVSLGIVLRFGKMELEKQAKQGGNEDSSPAPSSVK